jgi:predicted aspartyl protease
MASARNVVTAGLAAWALALAGASGTALAAKCTLVKVAEWPVRSTKGSPIVDGAINGQKVGVLLDTGSTTTLIMRAAAERLALVRSPARGVRMLGIGGETAVENAAIDELTIGEMRQRNFRALVAGEHEFGGDVALVLGEDFLHRVDVEFDLPHARVRLFEARDCEGAPSLAYWSKEGVPTAEIEPIHEPEPSIELTVTVNGRAVPAQLDSGAWVSTLTKAEAARLGVTPDSPGVVGAGCGRGLGQALLESWRGAFESIAIGNEVIRNPTLTFADLWRKVAYTEPGSLVPVSRVHPQLLLGADFLRTHRVLVAHSQRRIYFTYEGGTVFPSGPAGGCGETSSSGTK